jgi:hypothetical protein
MAFSAWPLVFARAADFSFKGICQRGSGGLCVRQMHKSTQFPAQPLIIARFWGKPWFFLDPAQPRRPEAASPPAQRFQAR